MPLKLISGGGGSVILSANSTGSNYTVTMPAENGVAITSGATTKLVPKPALPVGSVIQVVQTVFSATATYAPNGTEQQVTGLACNITPISSTNKILVMLNINYASTGTTYGGFFKRNGTAIGYGDAGGAQQRVGWGMALVTDTNQVNSFYYQYLDSPASTASVAYTVWVNNDNTGTLYVNRSVNDGSNNTGKRCISTVTLMEIVA